MKRRTAIQTLSASLGTLLALPAWANAWSGALLGESPGLFTADQQALLNEAVSTLIPDGQIPGAIALGVPAFIEKMIADCYEKPAQASFVEGLGAIDAQAKAAYNAPFSSLQSTQKWAVLTTMQITDNAPQKEFFSLLKNLTIQGYTTSEYVMVNHLNYVMAPGHYYGCVNV